MTPTDPTPLRQDHSSTCLFAKGQKADFDIEVCGLCATLFAALPESADEGLRTAAKRLAVEARRFLAFDEAGTPSTADSRTHLRARIEDVVAALAATLPATGGEGS